MRDHKKTSSGVEGLSSLKTISSPSSLTKTPSASSAAISPKIGGVQPSSETSVRAAVPLARRVSLTLSYQAASRLHSLSSGSGNGLSLLGILSGSVGDHHLTETSSLTPTSNHNNQSVASTSTGSTYPGLDTPQVNGDGRMATMQRVLHTMTAAAAAAHGHHSSTLASSTSSSNVLFQPNVVAPTAQPVPMPTTTASSHVMSSKTPFPFSSMTKVAQTIKTTTPPSKPPAHFGGVSDGSALHRVHHVQPDKTPLAKEKPTRNMAMSSPHLIKLLQGGEDHHQSPSLPPPPVPPAKRPRKKKETTVSTATAVTVKPPKEPKTKKKKLETTTTVNGISLGNQSHPAYISSPAYLVPKPVAATTFPGPIAAVQPHPPVTDNTPQMTVEPLLSNGQYGLSTSDNVLSSDILTEELNDDDLLDYLDNVDTSGMTYLLSDVISSTAESAAPAPCYAPSDQPNGSFISAHSPASLPSAGGDRWHHGASVTSTAGQQQPTTHAESPSTVVFKQPFVPKAPVFLPSSPAHSSTAAVLSSVPSSSRTNSSLSSTSVAAAAAAAPASPGPSGVRLEVALSSDMTSS